MPLTYEATQSGICGRCSAPYHSGDVITHGSGQGKRMVKYHAACPNGQRRPTELPQPMNEKEAAVPEPTDVDVYKTLADSLTPHLRDRFTPAIDENKVAAEIERIAREEVYKLVVPQTINITVDSKTYKIEGLKPHKNFATVAYLASKRKNVYIHGDPGWGKSEAAFQLAKAMKLGFDFITLVLQTSDTRLVGFRDAHGNYNATALRTMFEKGGLYLIDEVDRANGNTLTAMNGALANGRGSFPDGMITRHEDFICIATGNTSGAGANPNYPDCRPLDAAFQDRFFFVEWEEDNAFERTIALSINKDAGPWVEFVQKVRKYVKNNQIRLVISPRATYEGADLLKDGVLKLEQIAYGTMWRGRDVSTIKRIIENVPYPQITKAAAK